MSEFNPNVDFYFNNSKKWKKELLKLREILLETNLNEELKWGSPCYTSNNRNIVLIHEFKEYCAVLFFKGVLLKDREGILIQPTKNVQSARQIRFTEIHEVVKIESTLKDYIQEAIEVEKLGLKVEFKKPNEFEISEEFQAKFNEIPELKTAFDKLSPGRQRAYLLHFSAPKQNKTREARVEKCIPNILNGKGLTDV